MVQGNMYIKLAVFIWEIPWSIQLLIFVRFCVFKIDAMTKVRQNEAGMKDE